MEQGIKCPNCGGDKFKFISNDTLKCAYCGHMFTHKAAHTTNTNTTYTPPQQPISMVDRKDKTVAVLLALFLGGFGAHKFYLKQAGLGVLYIIFFWTYIPAIISFIECIMIAVMSKEEFDHKYNQY